jgi:hypothetical protein
MPKTLNIELLINELFSRVYGITEKEIIEFYKDMGTEVSSRTVKRYIKTLTSGLFAKWFYMDSGKLALKDTFPRELNSASEDLSNSFLYNADIFQFFKFNMPPHNYYELILQGEPDYKINKNQFELIIKSIKRNSKLTAEYKKKNYRLYPLLIFFYVNRWYLACLNENTDKIYKLSLDRIKSIRTASLIKDRSVTEDVIERARAKASGILKESSNIFVDINETEPVVLRLLETESNKPVNKSFSGYLEARTFVLNNIGRFKVKGPEDFKTKLKEDINRTLI